MTKKEMRKSRLSKMWFSVLAILLVIGFYPGFVFAEEAKGTADNPYQIGTAEELFSFSDLVNKQLNERIANNDLANTGTAQANNYSSSDLCAVLTADIDISGKEWDSIGKYYDSHNYIMYTGTFDGAGHTISGMTINTSDSTQGFFDIVGESCTIKDLTVQGTITSSAENQAITGGVIGQANVVKLENVVSKVNIDAKGTSVGGIIGAAGEGGITVAHCSNHGNINVSAMKSNTSGGVGGLIGRIGKNVTISDCNNTGTVQFVIDPGFKPNLDMQKNNLLGIGGIAGVASASTIERCSNSGSIYSEAKSTGGIAGRVTNGSSITLSYNSASVSGANEVGGIAGAVNFEQVQTLKSCYNTGEVSLNAPGYKVNGNLKLGGIIGGPASAKANIGLENCYNTGLVKIDESITSAAAKGGIVGNTKYTTTDLITFNNCYHLDTSAEKANGGDDTTESNVAKTAEEMKTGEFISILGSDFVADTASINDGYPVFQWMINQSEVNKVNDIIAALPSDITKITLDDQKAIEDASAAFEALSDELKDQIPEDVKKHLTDALTKLEELKKAASQQNKPSTEADGPATQPQAKSVSLKAVTNLAVTSNIGGKKLTLKYNKVSGASSYRIAYKLNKAKKWKTVTSKKNSYIFKKIKKNTTLTVKVQAVAKAAGKNVYGPYSTTNYFLQNTTKLKKAASAKKSAKARWKKASGVTGYQISWSLKKTFAKPKMKLVKGAKKTAFTIKKLKSRKKYFVRIRPYKVVKGKKYFGAWSAAKKVKAK